MDINKCLLKSIDDSLDFNGISIELNDNFEKRYFKVTEEVEKDTIRTYIDAKHLNSNMFLYTFASMLKNNELTIEFNENSKENNIDYLKKLSKDL